MSVSYSFREANQDDLDLLVDWTLQLMTHEALDESLELPLKDDIKDKISQWLSAMIDSDHALFIIAQYQADIPVGVILGLLQMAPNDFIEDVIHGLIQMIWVEPDIRRTGLAKQLLEQMESTFKNLDISYIEISHSVINQEAEGFWLKNGYQPVSKTCRKFL